MPEALVVDRFHHHEISAIANWLPVESRAQHATIVNPWSRGKIRQKAIRGFFQKKGHALAWPYNQIVVKLMSIFFFRRPVLYMNILLNLSPFIPVFLRLVRPVYDLRKWMLPVADQFRYGIGGFNHKQTSFL